MDAALKLVFVPAILPVGYLYDARMQVIARRRLAGGRVLLDQRLPAMFAVPGCAIAALRMRWIVAAPTTMQIVPVG